MNIPSVKARAQLDAQNRLLKLCYIAELEVYRRTPDLSMQQRERALQHIARARIIALFGV